jgi:hypothetical protein
MAARSDSTVESDLAATDCHQNGEHALGRAIIMLSKKEPCVVHGLSVFLFFQELQKIRPPARKKMEGNSGPDPLILGTNILGNLLLQDLHLIRCGRNSEVKHVALKVLKEADFHCLYSAAGVGITSAAAWSPAGAAAASTAASSSPTTHCEE